MGNGSCGGEKKDKQHQHRSIKDGYTDESRSLQQPAHLSVILLIVSYNGEDDQVQEVDQEVEKKHWTCKGLPLPLQQPAQRLRLEHLVTVLRGDRRGQMFEYRTTTSAALTGLMMLGLTGMSLP